MSEALEEAPVAGDAVDALAAEPQVEATPAAPAAPAYSDEQLLELAGPLVDRMLQERMAPLLPALEQFIANDPNAPVAGALDPFSDDFAGGLDARLAALEQRIAERFDVIAAPLAAREQAETVAQGEERLKDILADDVARNGEFSSKPDVDAQARTLVRTIADQMFPAIAERFGATPRAAEMAMTRAATSVRELLAAERSAGAEQETNRLATLAGIHGDPRGGAEGLQTAREGKILTSRELALKYGAKATALRG